MLMRCRLRSFGFVKMRSATTLCSSGGTGRHWGLKIP